MNMLIGITGAAGSGKDTVADHLFAKHSFTPTSFARPLKQAVKDIFWLTDTEMTDRDLKEKVNPFWGLSPRTIMQRFGTEAMRGTFGNEIWIRTWHRVYQALADTDHIVVSDVRFEDEAKAVRDLGGKIIHIVRPNNPHALASGTAGHTSESGIACEEGDIILQNNGTLNQLRLSVDEILQLGMGA